MTGRGNWDAVIRWGLSDGIDGGRRSTLVPAGRWNEPKIPKYKGLGHLRRPRHEHPILQTGDKRIPPVRARYRGARLRPAYGRCLPGKPARARRIRALGSGKNPNA